MRLYRLLIESQYCSDYFKKELERYTQPEKYVTKTNTYDIDVNRRVTVKFTKKFKYDSLDPFEVSEKIHKMEVLNRKNPSIDRVLFTGHSAMSCSASNIY